MGNWKITLFEYHSNGGQIDLFSGDSTESETDDQDDESGGRGIGAILVGVVFLVAIGVVVQRMRNRDDEEPRTGFSDRVGGVKSKIPAR